MTRREAVVEQQRLFPNMCLLEICSCLRGGVNGSADPWRPEEIQQTVSMLEARLQTWEPSCPKISIAYDDAVYALVKATLAEVVHYTF
jgi:hypothetical protein